MPNLTLVVSTGVQMAPIFGVPRNIRKYDKYVYAVPAYPGRYLAGTAVGAVVVWRILYLLGT